MTKIYTIFLPHYFSMKEEIITKLRSQLDDVKFTGFSPMSGITDTAGSNVAYQDINRMRDELAGIIVFGGFLDHQVTSFGLPVIFVQAVLGAGDWQKGILTFYNNEKVLTTSLSDVDISQQISETRFVDLVNKIKLIGALNKVKQTKLLCVQEPEILGNYDVYGMDFHIPLPDDYNRLYAKNLTELGLNIQHVSLTELTDELIQVNETESKKIADSWISDAKEINKETNRDEIIKAARMYLGMEILVEKYQAQGIIMRSLVPWSKKMIDVTPCLANMEFNKQLKVGVCEGLVNSAVTELFGLYSMGRPTFIGDVIGIDKINDTVIFAHCQSPINPHGSDRVPYVIRSHALQKANAMLPKYYPEIGKSISAAIKVDLPIDEIVTITKMSVYHKKISISSGVTVSGATLYKDFDDRLCRTKLAVKMNAKSFEQHYDTATFGVHRNILFGNFRNNIQELARIIGYEVIQEDRQ